MVLNKYLTNKLIIKKDRPIINYIARQWNIYLRYKCDISFATIRYFENIWGANMANYDSWKTIVRVSQQNYWKHERRFVILYLKFIQEQWVDQYILLGVHGNASSFVPVVSPLPRDKVVLEMCLQIATLHSCMTIYNVYIKIINIFYHLYYITTFEILNIYWYSNLIFWLYSIF